MKKDQLKYVFVFLGMGWYVAVAIVLGVLAGLWLDNQANTRPLFTLLGLLLGLVVAFWGVYRMVVPLLKLDTKKKKRKTNSPPAP